MTISHMRDEIEGQTHSVVLLVESHGQKVTYTLQDLSECLKTLLLLPSKAADMTTNWI